MAWPYDDDLISKIRGSINNGFSIGMGGKDRIALADLANLQGRLDTSNAPGILGRAADDIGFGSGGSKYTLAAMGKLGNGVSGLDPMERIKMERAGVEGFAEGGVIPGPVSPVPADDTIIEAKRGEYVIPEDVVNFLGVKTFDDMIAKAKARMGGEAAPPPKKAPGEGYATGGLVLDPEKRPDYAQPFTSLSDLMGNQERQKFIPNQEQIGVTIDNGSSVTPVYNPASSKPSLGQPLTEPQYTSLHQSWGIKPLDQLTTADKQYMANMPISMGATEGTYGNLADVTKRALADSVDKANAGMGLMVRSDPQAEAARLGFRGGLSRTNELEQAAQLRAQTLQDITAAKAQNALDVANLKGDRAWQIALLKAVKGGGSGTVGDPSNVDALAQAIASGNLDPGAISKRGALQAQVFAKVREINPEFNFNQATANAVFAKNAGVNRSVKILDSIDPVLGELEKSHKDLGFGRFPGVNKAKAFALEQTGDPRFTAYNNLRNNIILEMTNAMQGSSQMSDARVKMETENLKNSQSPAQMRAAIENIRKVIGARKEAFSSDPFPRGGVEGRFSGGSGGKRKGTASEYLKKFGGQ